ncbi:MAG: T9SS type A sorting domain-containing protein [Flavobacteriales bacterium]
MKKNVLLLFTLILFGQISAQTVNTPIDGTTEFVKNSGFRITPPLRDLAELIPEFDEKDDQRIIHNNRLAFPAANPDALPKGVDPIAQLNMGERMFQQRAPLVQWNGMNGGTPPDPSGAAGPNHFVQAVNTSWRVYNKSGGTLTASASLSSLWSGSSNSGDPIVMYDRHADRWFISQFQTGNNAILIAVSTTNDPTGTYYAYSFIPVASQFPDYPKFSIWHDGYYMTANYSTKRIVVFDRAKILVGDPSAGMLIRNMPSTPSNGFFCALPADADGQLPPSGTPCPVFSFEDDAWASGSADRIRVYNVSCDWSALTIDFTLNQLLPAQPFNSVFNASWNDIEQPGTTQKLDAIAGVLTYRAQYLRWTGYNTVTLCHVVKVDAATGQAGIRWYELRQNQSSGTWSIYQEGTYAPTTESRWCGSIAMDEQGNIGMAYAVSGSSTFPSIRYTGRLATDPLGQMTFIEQVGATGTSVQTGVNRFGDYSQTSLDPDGLTFWHTGEYISAGRKTRIFSFRIAGAAGVDEQIQGEIKVFQNGIDLIIEAHSLPNDRETHVDLFDIQGRTISEKVVLPVQAAFNTSINVSGLAAGYYLVRIGNEHYQRVIKVLVQ